MTNFSMASNMATKMRNPSTESETTTHLLLDVLNVLNLKPKMQPQSVCAYGGLKQVFPRVYSIYEGRSKSNKTRVTAPFIKSVGKR